MRIDVSNVGAATVVRPADERIDIEVAGDLRAELLRLIESGRSNLVVDLEGVSFIDSSGLGALVSGIKAIRMSGVGGDIRLANSRASVIELLEVIRLNRVFSTYPSVELAAQSFGEGR